jgi:DNA-binding MurR/RpiR family transcriptional regulator
VAIFLWQHPGEVALGTSSEVAAQAGVQPSTLVRFAQTFGFAGFSEFQDLYKAHVKGSWPEGRGGGKAAERLPVEASPDLRFIDGLVAASQQSLARIGEGFSTAAPSERMVDILPAPTSSTSSGRSARLPRDRLCLPQPVAAGVRNVLVDNVGSNAFDQVGCVRPADAVLAVSFSPYNSITLNSSQLPASAPAASPRSPI